MKVVIVKKGTIEGFTAGWVAQRSLKRDCELIHFGDGDELPTLDILKGRDVLMFGVAFRRPILERLIKQCNSIFVFDNDFHVKAEIGSMKQVKIHLNQTPARMAWEYLRSEFTVRFKDKKEEFRFLTAPWIVDYSDEKGLWKWPTINRTYVRYVIDEYKMTLDSWDELATRDLICVEENGKLLNQDKPKQEKDDGETETVSSEIAAKRAARRRKSS